MQDLALYPLHGHKQALLRRPGMELAKAVRVAPDASHTPAKCGHVEVHSS
jgi:hypothetical protein